MAGAVVDLERTEADRKVQRAIEGRYLPAARAERLEAQAEHRAKAAASAPHVGWSVRATNADRRHDAARAAAEAARFERLTDEDKALRRATAERDQRWDHKRHATSATMEEAHRPGRLAQLCLKGEISADQLESARAIDDAYQATVRDVCPRTASFETRIDAGQRGDGTFFEALGAVRREKAYEEWRTIMARLAPIAAVLAMIVNEPLGYSVVARRFGMGDRRAKAVLIAALDLWPRCYADARRLVSAADLAAAQAGL